MKYTEEDRALMEHAPTVAVPVFGEFVAMEENGHRYLLACDGLWLEVRRPWLHLIWPVAQQKKVQLPYGNLAEVIDLAFEVPTWGFTELLPAAREVTPAEVGAAMIWNERERTLRFAMCKTISAGVGTLSESMPELGEGDWLAVDLHSHGPLDAFFSSTDLEDTGSEVVIAGVIGRVDSGDPEVTLSLFAHRLELQLVSGGSKLSTVMG